MSSARSAKHVPAIIDQRSLDAALRRSGVLRHDLLTNIPKGCPELVFPTGFRLQYLHGLHRIQAARDFLSPRNKWWAVDLYISDLDSTLKTCLVEEYANEDKPSDGEIYRKIRQNEHNVSLKMRWKARLRGQRAQNLNTLQERRLDSCIRRIAGHSWALGRHDDFHPAQDDGYGLLQEILRYLNHIKQVWSSLVGNDKIAMHKIDQATVMALELKAPRASTLDAEALHSQIKGGELFSAFTDAERDGIWKQLQKVCGLIPSLYTFFKDLLYLQVCVDCIKRLSKSSPKQSVCDAIERKFIGKNLPKGLVKIQVAEYLFKYLKGDRVSQIDLGYRQLHAYAMRHYPDMPKEAVRENPVKQPTAKADTMVLRGLAALASQLGFDSPEISALKPCPNAGTDHEYDRHARPLLVTTGLGVAKSQRCGKPHSRSFEEDRSSLFINHLHDVRQDRSEGITSFFVWQSVYFAFFGRPVASPISSTTTYQGLNRSPVQRESLGSIDEDIDELLSCYGASQDESLLENERQEQERQEQEQREQEKVQIFFRMWEREVWREQPSLFIHPANSSEVERITKKYMRKNIRLFNTKFRMLTPKDCFRAALDSRTHTILLIAQDDLLIDDAMLQSASKIHDEAVTRVLGLKRAAENDISKEYHNQKRRMLEQHRSETQ